VVASIQTLAARKFTRLKRLMGRGAFRIVIVDEAHHAAAPTYRTALVHLGFLPPADSSEEEEIEAPEYDDVAVMESALQAWDEGSSRPKDRLLLGMTATPNRTDAIGLSCVFQTIAYSYSLKKAIEDKFLVPIVPWCVESKVDLDSVRITHGEFNQKDLAEAVNKEERNRLAVAAWNDHAYGLSTLAFAVDVEHAYALAEKFRAAGVKTETITGETPKDERRGILRAYQAGEITVLSNCMVLTEGTDLPRTGCILHAKPTKSATLYEQMTGRGLRIHPGKTECIVIDVVDIARRHSLQTAPVLSGLPPGLITKGEDLEALVNELEALAAKYPGMNIAEMLEKEHLTLEQLKARAVTFDIWTIPDLGTFGLGRTLQWIKRPDGSFSLEYPWRDGYERVHVDRDLLGKWEITLTMKPKDNPAARRQRTIAVELPTAEAAGAIAEAYIGQERGSVLNLKSQSAPWRLQPASDKQVAILRRLRVPFKAGLTKGEASDLLDLANARKGR
jgi:ATP-dependent helicase IRC3